MSCNDSIMLSVSTLDRIFRKRGERLVESAGITIGQFRVLAAVREGGPLYQKELERACVISRAGASGLVDILVSSGLLLRERVDSDARLRRLSLTDKGEEKLEEAEALLLQVDGYVSSLLSEEDKKDFLRVAGLLLEGLGE